MRKALLALLLVICLAPQNISWATDNSKLAKPVVRDAQSDESTYFIMTDRYENGELYHADSIKTDKTKQYKTPEGKTVYGGGGIMPDVFVALDTTDITDYYSSLIRGGHVNSYSLEYVNTNREQLKKKYPDVKAFIANFNTDASFMEGFFSYVSKEDPKLTFDQQAYDISGKSIRIRIKSNIAQDLFGYSESYQIFNELNEVVQKATMLYKDKSYQGYDLAD